jgi:hypothetical protein
LDYGGSVFSTLVIFSVPIVLVGNKNDLFNEREVSMEDGKKLAQRMKAVFLETSAKNNQVLRFSSPLSLGMLIVFNVFTGCLRCVPQGVVRDGVAGRIAARGGGEDLLRVLKSETDKMMRRNKCKIVKIV